MNWAEKAQDIVEAALPLVVYVPGADQITAPLSTAFVVLNQRKMRQLEAEIRRAFTQLRQIDAGKIDGAYLGSDAFAAHIVQACRAAQVAESQGKMALIADGLAGCTLLYDEAVNKALCMRIIEQISDVEISILKDILDFFEIFLALNNPKDIVNIKDDLTKMSYESRLVACQGLFQLGLLNNEAIGRLAGPTRDLYSPSILARHVLLISQWATQT